MSNYSSLGDLARMGEKLYEEKIKALVEPAKNGDFVAIEIDSGNYLLGKTAEDVLLAARERFPNKIFHLMRVGFQSAFSHARVSRLQFAYDGIV